MPSWAEHREYCKRFGIRLEVCDFANRLCDEPYKVIPELLRLYPDLMQSVSQKSQIPTTLLKEVFSDTEEYGKKTGGVEYCVKYCGKCEPVVNHERREIIFKRPRTIEEFLELRSMCPLERKNPYAITHLKVHEVWNKELEDYRSIIKAIAEYCFGEEGKRAVELHLGLDERSHILNAVLRKIPNILAKGIKGTVRWEDRYLQISNIVKKYLKKDYAVLSRYLSYGKNHEVFVKNLNKLMKMKLLDIIPEITFYRKETANKTVRDLVDEYGEKELSWLKQLTKQFKT